MHSQMNEGAGLGSSSSVGRIISLAILTTAFPDYCSGMTEAKPQVHVVKVTKTPSLCFRRG